jgi:hypothetical protein
MFGTTPCAQLALSIDPFGANSCSNLAGPTKTGAAGTYNYLIDLILAVPATRAAYLRRLRSVSDQYHNGRLLQVKLLPPGFDPLPVHLVLAAAR